MKNSTILFSFFVLAIFSSCNKDSITSTENQVGISKVTHYVVLSLKGASIMSVVKGDAFVDPGVDASENGAPATYTVSGSVDNSTPGLYVLTYTATNKDGFSSSVSRSVVVIANHETQGVDISGSFAYVGSSTYTATITKVAEGVYYTDNCWSGGTIIPCIFVCLDGSTIDVPNQLSGFGPINGSGTLDNTGKLVFVISIPNFGISDSHRTWQKQ